MPVWVGNSWKASGLEASEWTKVRGNYMCCLVIVVIFVGEGVRGLKLSHGGKGKKPQTRETFMGRHKKTTQGVDH